MKKFLWFFAAFTLSALCYADKPSVQLRTDADPKEIHIGDPIKVKLSLTFSADVKAQPFSISTDTLGEFELLGLQSSEPKTDNQKTAQTHELLLTTFSTGTQTIPGLTLLFALPDGKPAEVKTEPIKINVKSLLAEKGDEGGLRPLKGLYNFRSFLWLWILLAILLIAGLVYWAVTVRRKKTGAAEPQGPPRPPEEIAWEAIQKLEATPWLANGQVKEYYSELTNILRRYLEDRYHCQAMERTTAELATEFRRLNLPTEVSLQLRDVFENGDLVKFAKFTPGETDIQSDLERTKKIITLTTPEKTATNPEEKIPV